MHSFIFSSQLQAWSKQPASYCILSQSFHLDHPLDWLILQILISDVFSFHSCYGGLGRSGLSKYQTLRPSVMCISNVKCILCVVLECNLCLIVIVAACLLLQLSVSMTASKALEILWELRGGGAIQTVKVRSNAPRLETYIVIFHYVNNDSSSSVAAI